MKLTIVGSGITGSVVAYASVFVGFATTNKTSYALPATAEASGPRSATAAFRVSVGGDGLCGKISAAPMLRRGLCVSALVLPLIASACRPAQEDRRPMFFADHINAAAADYDRTRFLSFRKDARLSSPVTLDDETRISLTPPLPSRFSFEVHIPPEPFLRFAIGVDTLTLGELDVWPPIEFVLTIDAGDGARDIFVETVDRSRPDQWLDREADLGEWADSTVRLTFETRLRREGQRIPWTARRVLPVWGNPVLADAAGRDHIPRLILISVDCLRPDHMGIYGYERNTTPHIDAFAKDGVVFETAVGTSSWTLPTHMSMLTGLPPSLHGASKTEKLDRSIPYLPELLAGNGYQTDAVTSWVYVSQTFGFERGFHIFRLLDQPPATAVVDEALDLIHRTRGVNHFLFLHFFDPHWPYLPPADFLERFGPRPADISDLLDTIASGIPPASPSDVQHAVNLYDAEIALVDREIGRFLDELKKGDLYDRSLIILTGDHGEAFWEHGIWEHTSTLYEELIRVPLIIKWPENGVTGRLARQVSQNDIFATILSTAGIDPPKSWGMDLAGVVRNEATARRNMLSEVTWRSPKGTSMKIALRSQELKYIATLKGPPASDWNGLELDGEELYNLADDPFEQKNISAESHELIGAFRRELELFLKEATKRGSNRISEGVTLDEITKERLRSLGYIVQ